MLFVVALLVFAVSAAEVRPKYLFLLIGDGMGPNIVKFYRDQMGKTSFDKLGEPVPTGTNNCFGKTTDSAASGTALACGVKTYNGSMAMDKDKRPLTSLAKILKKRGMKVGIISSVSINDATPGTHYVNRVSRKDREGSFADLVASDFDFFGVSSISAPKNMKYKDLTAKLSEGGFTVYGPKSFANMKKGGKSIFYNSTQCSGKDGITHPKPSLADVTGKAIELLDNPNGFFMMVEGGAIDWCGHANQAAENMYEVLAFDDAVRVALKFAQKHPDETLIVVTGDHETGGMTMGFSGTGYAMYVERLANQKISCNSFAALEKKIRKDKKNYSFEDAQKLLEKYFGFKFSEKDKKDPMYISSKELKMLKDAFKKKQLAMAARIIMNGKAGIGWTTGSHTALPVLTTSTGVKSELFTGFIENCDIAIKIKSIL